MIVAQREAGAATLLHYQEMEHSMRREHGQSLADPAKPQFSSYATLRRGLSFEAHAIAWRDWLLDALASKTD